MNIIISRSISERLKRIDGTVRFVKCELTPVGEVQAIEVEGLKWEGIWEKEKHLLKLSIVLPDTKDFLVASNNSNPPEIKKYSKINLIDDLENSIEINNGDSDLWLCTGKNLFDIKFSDDYIGALSVGGTTDDTKTLETFGRYPGKSIFITGNEDSEVSKETYYNYWRIKVSDDETTHDLPILDEYGKLIGENYIYRKYSNFRLDCPGLIKSDIPNRKKISYTNGVVPITGLVDFIEYQVSGPHIYKVQERTDVSIINIPGFTLNYLWGQNDFEQVCDESSNVFSHDNYGYLIEYQKDQNPESGNPNKAIGLYEGIIYYYDIINQIPIELHSENKIKFVRGSGSGINWNGGGSGSGDGTDQVNPDTPYVQQDPETGESFAVFLFDKEADYEIETEINIPTSIVQSLEDTEITIEYENESITTEFFEINLDYERVDYAQDRIVLPLKMKTRLENTTPEYRPVHQSGNSLIPYKTTIKIQEPDTENIYSLSFYMVQKANVGGGIKFVDNEGNELSQVFLGLGSGEGEKTVHLVDQIDTNTQEDLGEWNTWVIIRSGEQVRYKHPSDSSWITWSNTNSPNIRGNLGTLGDSNFTNNLQSLKISSAISPQTAQTLDLGYLYVARINNNDASLNIDPNDWRIAASMAEAFIQIKKQGQIIYVNPIISSNPIVVRGVGLYKIEIKTNCRFFIKLNSTNINTAGCVLIEGNNIGSEYLQINSPSYDDIRYRNEGESFIYYLKVKTADYIIDANNYYSNIYVQFTEEFTSSVISPDSLSGNQRLSSENINVNIGDTNFGIYKLKNDKSPYSNGSWKLVSAQPDEYIEERWIKRSGYRLINISYFEGEYTISSGNLYNTANKYDLSRFVSVSENISLRDLEDYRFLNLSDSILSTFNFDDWTEIKTINLTDIDSEIENPFSFNGDYDSNLYYKVGDIVSSSGHFYIAKKSIIISEDTVEKNKDKIGDSNWWQVLDNNFDPGNIIISKLPEQFHYLGLKSNNLFQFRDEYLSYETMELEVNNIYSTTSGVINNIISGQRINFIVDHPEEYRAGTVIKLNYFPSNETRGTITDRFYYDVNNFPIQVNNSQVTSISKYLVLDRDSKWVIVNDSNSLKKATGSSIIDYSLNKNCFNYLVEFSILLPRLDHRNRIHLSNPNGGADFIINPYSSGDTSTLNNLSQLEYNRALIDSPEILELFELKKYKDIPAISKNFVTSEKVISTYFKLDDPTYSNKLISTNTSLRAKTISEYLPNNTYSAGNIVQVTTTSGIPLLYQANYSTRLNPTYDIYVDLENKNPGINGNNDGGVFNYNNDFPFQYFSMQLENSVRSARNRFRTSNGQYTNSVSCYFNYNQDEAIYYRVASPTPGFVYQDRGYYIDRPPEPQAAPDPGYNGIKFNGKVISTSSIQDLPNINIVPSAYFDNENLVCYGIYSGSDDEVGYYFPVKVILYDSPPTPTYHRFWVGSRENAFIYGVSDDAYYKYYFSNDDVFTKIKPWSCLNFKKTEQYETEEVSLTGYPIGRDDLAKEAFQSQNGFTVGNIYGYQGSYNTESINDIYSILNNNSVNINPGDIIAVDYNTENSNIPVGGQRTGDYYLYTAGWKVINIPSTYNLTTIDEVPYLEDCFVGLIFKSGMYCYHFSQLFSPSYAFNNIKPNKYLFTNIGDSSTVSYFSRKTKPFSRTAVDSSFTITQNKEYTLTGQNNSDDYYVDTTLTVSATSISSPNTDININDVNTVTVTRENFNI